MRLLILPLIASSALGAPPKLLNVSKPIPPDKFPNRVHVFEDYETEIEKRWWLRGKPETKHVPPGSSRACRGASSKDFDRKMGDQSRTYSAVVFNPVPGPPMGKSTRLRFRCFLKGASVLRVQIYSLSKGYHRCLTLTDVEQGKWLLLTVDMTKARRPDGSGGPLAENERIDDIQFYTDPKAELIIDDIVLYEAPVKGEKRPFPQRFHFTGWFDTGKQGKEWPGTFDIVEKNQGYFWDAARSVPRKEGGAWIRLHLRGPRPLSEKTVLRFRYHLRGTEGIEVRIKPPKGEMKSLKSDKLAQGEWAETSLSFRMKGVAEEIRFLLPDTAELKLDDVLLFEP